MQTHRVGASKQVCAERNKPLAPNAIGARGKRADLPALPGGVGADEVRNAKIREEYGVRRHEFTICFGKC